MKKNSGKRIGWIDISKGIGVFLLVLGHMPSLPYGIQNWIYSFHMPLFFALSGYTYCCKGSLRKEIGKSFKNLIIPYIIYSIVFFGIDLMLFGTEHTIVKDDISNIISGQGSFGVIWFLLSMFWVRLMYSISEKMLNEKVRAVVITICVCTGYLISKYTDLDLYKIITSMVAIGFFYVGVLLKKHKIIEHIYNSKKRIICIIGLFILSIGLSYLNLKIYGLRIELSGARYNFLPLTFICAISGLMAIMCCTCRFSDSTNFIVSVVKHIGKYSLWYFALTAYIPTRIMDFVDGTQFDNIYVKIVSKIFGFVLTFLIIKSYYYLKGKHNEGMKKNNG